MQFVQQIGGATALQHGFLNISYTAQNLKLTNLKTTAFRFFICMIQKFWNPVKNDIVNMLIIDFHQISILAKT